jgi:uncharacterized membrane protein
MHRLNCQRRKPEMQTAFEYGTAKERRLSAKPRAVIILLTVIMLLGLSTSAEAQSRSLYWRRLDVDIQVQPNGDMRITETNDIVFQGGPFRFGYAAIPPGRWDQIRDVTVTDETGQVYQRSTSESPYTYYTDRDEDGNFVIQWYFPSTRDREHTYIIAYTVVGGLRYYEDRNEVYWKAIAPDHDYPIQSSTVTVRLPPGAAVLGHPDNPLAAVTMGAPAAMNVSADGSVVTFSANRAIRSGEQMEVHVPFPLGFVTGSKPAWQAEIDRQEEWNSTGRRTADFGLLALGALLLILGPGLVYVLWYTRGRDPQVGLAAPHIAGPPSDVRPGLAGTLLDERADMQDIMATLVDLARRGYLTITEENQPGLFGIGASRDFVYTRTDKPASDLLSFERTLLERLFGRSGQQRLSQLRNKFYTAVPVLQGQLYDESVKAGFFRGNPQSTRSMYTALGFGLLFVVGIAGFVLMAALAESFSAYVICPFIALGIAAIALMITGQFMPARTRKGAEEAAKWRAFKNYLANINKYTKVKEATDQFDKYLPYAIAFGLERSWISAFSQVETVPMPMWYRPWVHMPGPVSQRETVGSGRGGLARPMPAPGEGVTLDGMSEGLAGSLNNMSEGLTSMLNSAGNVFTSSPQPSGGRGGGSFRGGGFSGGGGGGGGGGRGFG